MNNKISNFYLMTAVASLAANFGSAIDWRPNTRFNAGSKVRAGDNTYLSVASGVTGVLAPVHTSGSASDGSLTWWFAGSAQIPSGSLGSNMYLSLGGPEKWKNEPSPDDVLDEQSALRDSKVLMRLMNRDVCLGFEKNPWVSGVIAEWPSPSSYVTNSIGVYRCLSNNLDAISTQEPTGIGIATFETTDGYIWKYLGNLSEQYQDTFESADAYAIYTLSVDDGSDRWTVQQAANNGQVSGFTIKESVGVFTNTKVSVIGDGTGGTARTYSLQNGEVVRIVPSDMGRDYTKAVAIVQEDGAPGTGGVLTLSVSSGSITNAVVTNQGSGYADGAICLILGDGAGGSIALQVNGGYITGASVAQPGSGYSYATAYVVPGDSGVLGDMIPAPIGGHGRDMMKELPVNYLLINRRITSLDAAYLLDQEFRQIGIVTGVLPKTGIGSILAGPKNENPSGLDMANINNARAIFVSNIGSFQHGNSQDEEIRISMKVV